MAGDTLARLAAGRRQVPESLSASLAFWRGNTRLAFANTSYDVTSRVLGSFSTLAILAAGSRRQIPVVCSASVAFESSDIRLTNTLTSGLLAPENEGACHDL